MNQRVSGQLGGLEDLAGDHAALVAAAEALPVRLADGSTCA